MRCLAIVIGESGFEERAGQIIVSGYSGICFEIKFSGVCHAKGKRKKERERPSCYNYPIYPGLGPVHSMLDWIPWDLVHIQSTTAVSASFNVYTSQPAVPLRFRNNF